MSLLDPRAIRDWCRQKFQLKDDMLKTKESVEANTEEGMSVDALVIKEVFQSVSDGKEKIASAITGKGVQTGATATFEEMAVNIGNIQSGGSGSCPITSPYLFIFTGSKIPFSTGAGSFTIYFPVNKVTKFLIKKFYFYVSKSGSNSTGLFYFYIYGVKGGVENTIIRQWQGSVASASTSTTVVNITADTEVDLTDVTEITKIVVGKTSVSGTVIQISAAINFEAELYF